MILIAWVLLTRQVRVGIHLCLRDRPGKAVIVCSILQCSALLHDDVVQFLVFLVVRLALEALAVTADVAHAHTLADELTLTLFFYFLEESLLLRIVLCYIIHDAVAAQNVEILVCFFLVVLASFCLGYDEIHL